MLNNHRKIKSIVKKIFLKRGLKISHANICANAILNAELVGARSHGLSRLKMYCERISKKVINLKPKITVKNISKTISIIDAES